MRVARDQIRSESEAILNVSDLVCANRNLTGLQQVPGFEDELYYFALAVPSGRSLAECLRHEPKSWDRPRRARVAVRLIHEVERIHQAEIPRRNHACVVHRRLNPAVVFVDDGDRLTISGWDVARATPETAYAGQRQFPATAYDAPEIAEDLTRASPESDAYSLGRNLIRAFLWPIAVWRSSTQPRPRRAQPASSHTEGPVHPGY